MVSRPTPHGGGDNTTVMVQELPVLAFETALESLYPVLKQGTERMWSLMIAVMMGSAGTEGSVPQTRLGRDGSNALGRHPTANCGKHLRLTQHAVMPCKLQADTKFRVEAATFRGGSDGLPVSRDQCARRPPAVVPR